MSNDGSQAAIEQAAQFLSAHGLSRPAALLLETMAPLGFVGSQAMLLVEPLMSPGARRIAKQYADILQDRSAVRRLIERIHETDAP